MQHALPIDAASFANIGYDEIKAMLRYFDFVMGTSAE